MYSIHPTTHPPPTPPQINPNLYADGKVCLSLLGTWHGGDATEKWDPLRSNYCRLMIIRAPCREVSCRGVL